MFKEFDQIPSLLYYNPLSNVFGWITFWFILYKFSFKIFLNKSSEHGCRIVTLLHAVTITASSCYITFFNGTNPLKDIGLPNTNPQFLVLSACLGFFLFDFAWCLYYQTEDVVIILHHVVAIVFMSACLYLGVSGAEVVATIFESEVTSIVLNIRWFLKAYNLYKGVLQMFVDLLFFAMFLVVRLILGGFLNYKVFVSDLPPLVIKMGGFFFYIINCLFFLQIISFIRHQLKKWNQQYPNGKVEQNNNDFPTPVLPDENIESKKKH